MRTMCKFAFAVILSAAFATTAQAQQMDGVVGPNGISTFGTITATTSDQVTIRTRTGDTVFPVDEIQKIMFAEDPKELRRARDLVGRDQLESARSELQKVSTAGITRPEVLQDIAFYKAYVDGKLAISGGGDKTAAVTALRDFAENPANRNSPHYYDCVQLLGDLAVALGRNDAATKYYGLLEKAPWPAYQMRAGVLLARALYANRQIKESLDKYNSLLAMPRDDARSREQKLFAQIGKAECTAELGQPEEGIAVLDKIITENDPQKNALLFARAYNALGTCYLKLNKPKDALLAYLHVDLLFFHDPDSHAEALYHLRKLWGTVNRPERARQADNLLKTRYGGTAWASRA